MLGIGIDWAEEFHDVAFGTQEKGVVEQFRIEHGPAGVAALIERALRTGAGPGRGAGGAGDPHGLLVEALLDAGFTVVPVNPDLVARRRGPARKKDDTEDARICCLLALDRHAALKTLIPHGELGGELRAIGRDDERAARDQRRLLNRLRADLQTTYPAALTLAGEDLGAPTVLRLLQRWPTQPELAAGLPRGAGRVRPRRPPRLADRFADRVTTALADAVVAHPGLPGARQGRRDPAGRGPAARAARGPPRLGSSAWPSCCSAGRRTGRDHTVKDPDPGNAFPGGVIYLSFPGLGDRLAARVAGEIGEHIGQFDHPERAAVLRRRAPVTRRSGKSDFVVARRLAHNRYLGDAVHQWAFCSLIRSGWAREFYDQQDHRRQEPPRRPARPGQPLAGDPLALPDQGRALRREPSTSPTATEPSDAQPERGCS